MAQAAMTERWPPSLYGKAHNTYQSRVVHSDFRMGGTDGGGGGGDKGPMGVGDWRVIGDKSGRRKN